MIKKALSVKTTLFLVARGAPTCGPQTANGGTPFGRPLHAYVACQAGRPVFDSFVLEDALGGIGRFDEGEVRRQDEILVAVHGVDDLFGYDVAAAVAGNDQGIDFLSGKGRFFLAEQGRQPVEESHDVGADGVIIIRADQDDDVALADSGIDFFHHDAAVETVPFFTEMEARFIAAAPAVDDGPVAQGNLRDPGLPLQMALHHFPEEERVRRAAAAGVEDDDVLSLPGPVGPGESQQFTDQAAGTDGVGFLIGKALDLGLGIKIMAMSQQTVDK